MPAYTTVVTHSTGDVLPASDWNTYIRDNLANLHDRNDVASAATIVPTTAFTVVSGVVTVSNISPATAPIAGDRMTLMFTNAGCALATGGNIFLINGPFVSAATTPILPSISFRYVNGTGWVEVARANGPAAVPPGTQLDYQQITAPVATGAVTTEGTAVAIVTGNSVTYDGTRVRLQFWYPSITGGAALVATGVFVKDGTAIGQFKIVDGNQTVNNGPSGIMFDTPSAAAHTYAVKAFVNATGVTINAGAGGAGALLPAFLQVTKV